MAPPTKSDAIAHSFARFGAVDVPYAEPAWYRGTPTPYYKPSHVELRARMRAFVDEHLLPHVDEWEERCARYGEEVDFKRLTRLAAGAGILAPMYPAALGGCVGPAPRTGGPH